jgi:TPR repeat protein
MRKGGAAKGELVLAIFELANCFRHGWGVPVDKVAAAKASSKDWIGKKPES